MSALQPLWNQRHLAIVHAAGSPDPSRSHFDAQDFMESGTPGIKATEDGWLNRACLHSLRRPTSRPSAPLDWGHHCREFFPERNRRWP